MEMQDDPLWKIARKRAKFKQHFAVYLIMSAFFWAIWYFTDRSAYMWPIWPMLGWGLGLAFNYYQAYHFNEDEMTRKEYEKLKGPNS
jgi:hypothetical protein